MKEKLINFFLKRHLLTNLFFVTVFVGGVFSWMQIPKEELPDITFDSVRVSVSYPGASAEEVEYYVTRPIEEEIRGLDGIHRITSSTGIGTASVNAEIEKNYPDKDEVISDIRSAVLDVDLPDDIRDDPRVRVFKTSRKAIIDVGLFIQGKNILDVESRQILQEYALALENKLLSLPEVSSVRRSGYLDEEIHIRIYPERLIDYRIPLNSIMNEIQKNNVRQPAGNIENTEEPKVILSGELTDVEALKELAIQGGFEGQVVRLKDVADVARAHEKTKTVTKINGHEGIFLNVVKSSQVGIIDAVDVVKRVVSDFSLDGDDKRSVKIAILDDESFDVRNRLSIIGLNGAIGFILILLMLFLFLNLRAGLWVAAGIPFTFCFTLIGTLIAGYSVNNVTLAAVIIVMGMVVDDAIVVSENIIRLKSTGMPMEKAAVDGTSFVFLPIVASILTTCVAFVPLYFFTGRFGAMVTFLPLIIILMLGGSLLEALFILPGHMTLTARGLFPKIIGNLSRIFPKRHASPDNSLGKHWFTKCEDSYEKLLRKVFPVKPFIFAAFFALLLLSWYLASSKMKFVMFPGEETRQIRITAETPSGTTRYKTALLSQPIEDIISGYIGKEVVGFRNEIARTRRGSVSQENRFRMRVEILPKEKRKKSADQLIKEWKEKFSQLPGIHNIKFSKGWHGQEGASPIELLVKENNDTLRRNIADEMALLLEKHPALFNVEIDRPVMSPEYKITLDRDKIRRLAISPSDVAKTLRAGLEGVILYDFMGDDEEVYVRITTVKEAKDKIEKLLNIPVENEGQYLVPIKDIVEVQEVAKPDSLIRENLKRITTIYADIKPASGATPVDIAEHFESTTFKEISRRHPSTILEFAGEVKDTRESRKDFFFAIIMAIAMIYVILAVLFNSLYKPLIIMLSIPFGIVGIILAFRLHGISQYGFFAVIGALGLAGVVVNDAIIMLTKLDKEFKHSIDKRELNGHIAGIAKTRLRAVILTTLTTVVGIMPTAYGWAGYDSMLSQMMLALGWGLFFGTLITLILIPCIYTSLKELKYKAAKGQVA
jgi:multidrug efflux pump subunit AcrB